MSFQALHEVVQIDYNELEDYKSDPLVICPKKFLSKISGNFFTEPVIDKPEQDAPVFDIKDWYPYCNSYYPYTEHVDPFARVNHLLTTNPSSPQTSSSEKSEERRTFFYSTREAQIEYLQSKPLSFLILGKPSIGEEELGKQLAEYWQCVYIDPETLIKEEIETETRSGQCIEFNLRCGRAIGIDVILRLVEKRIRTQSVAHRGFVLCGLPVIPNDLYEEDPVSAESAVFTVQEIFEEILESICEYTAAPTQHLLVPTPSRTDKSSPRTSKIEWGDSQWEKSIGTPDLGSIKDSTDVTEEKVVDVVVADDVVPLDLGDPKKTVCDPPKISTDYEGQLNFITNLFNGPYLIIYMVCENQDVINKRKEYRYDIYSETLIDVQKERVEKDLFSLFSNKNQLGLGASSRAEDLFENIPSLVKDSSELIHLVQLPGDFPAHVQTQLQRFHDIVTKLIEAKILVHNPEYYLKVDGRTNTTRMFNSVKWKLRILTDHRVVIPEKLMAPDTHQFEGESNPEEKREKFEDLNECFKDFSRRNIVNPMLKWEWSDWGTRCPVAMIAGHYLDGHPNYAVTFMSNIFFLSSQDAFIKFHRNPRPFLLPPNPRSHGKLYIIGPGCSGKTAVSNFLGHMLNCTVLSPIAMYKNFINMRRENLMERMRQAMINDKLTSINTENMRQRQIEKRIVEEKVQVWLSKFRHYIENENLKPRKSKSDAQLKLSSFPVLLGSKAAREEIEREVPFEGIYLNESTARDLWEHPDRMKMYLPEDLRKKVPEFVPVTVLDESVLRDIEDYVRNSDMDEIILGEEDLLEMYGTAIKQEEDEYMSREKCKGGWIIDGLTFDFNFFQRVYDECPPEHVIVLEDSSGGEFLMERYKSRGLNVFTDYRNFFESIGRPDIASRIEEQDPEYLKERIVGDILGDILTRKEFLIEPDDEEGISDSVLLGRRESQMNYRVELDEYSAAEMQILDFLHIMNKDVIVLDVNNKSIEDVLRDVYSRFNDKYRLSAEVFSDRDRLQEARDFGHVGDAEGGVEGFDQKEKDEFEMNRRYGDTFHFCPVIYFDHWVLWKGKKEFMARFQEKLYFCSSEKDLNDFVHHPRKYLPLTKPAFPFPPPRICVVGHTSSGKTSIGKAISKNFALCYFNFIDFLRKKGKDNENHENYQLIQDYLVSDSPLPGEFLLEFLHELWFDEPYKSMGFVLDDFPKMPSDITIMVAHKLIPDTIIYLKVSDKEISQRNIRKHLAEWQIQMDQMRSKLEEEHLQILSKWEQDRQERFDHLMETRRARRYSLKKQDRENQNEKPPRPYLEDLQETDEETDRSTFRSKSQVTFDSVAEQEDMDEVTKLLMEELPEPVPDKTTESIEGATERIRTAFAETHSREIACLKEMKELCLAALIPWQEIKSEKLLEITEYEVYLAVDKFKFRNNSFFERTYEVSIEAAERLLATGYYFLSMFGRTCPVQYYKQDVPIQLFIPMEQKFNVFPMIHRQYIYFVIDKQNKEAFRTDPLKYVQIKKFNFPLMPIRIAIIGPPKCGKSVLADRFRTELGLKVISKGQAARYVKNFLAHSTLAMSMESRLRAGLGLKEKMVLNCVEASMYDPRAVTQGVLMDGFPNSSKEVKYLASMGIMPQLVIDLFTEDPNVYEYVSSNALKLFDPPFSKRFMAHRLKVWEEDQKEFRDWLNGEYQNIVRMPINTCMWDIWEEAYEFVKAAVYEIKHYHIHSKDDWPLRLSYMLVSPLEFLERQSGYKTYCPGCLFYFNKLSSGEFPPDRTGLVHFRNFYYYICPLHIEEFLETPGRFLAPYNPNKLPPYQPEKIELTSLPDNIYEDGYCVTCYKDNMKSNKGVVEYACKCDNYTYLFDTMNCMKTFMASPLTYCNVHITLKDNINYPSLSYKDLPPLGTLEQFVAKDIIKAIKSTTSIRPVIPGLSIEQSALVTMAMFLKINNKQSDKYALDSYKKALDVMTERRKSLLRFLEIFKKYRNPFIYYEEPVPPLKISEWIKERFGHKVASWSYTDIKEDKAFRKKKKEHRESARRVPVPDSRFDYLCEYFKPLSKVPAFLNVVDIAGLVKGASEGQGLGNAFLSHISACDAIFHLCRAFEDDDVTHVEGEVNPVRDLEIINEELRLKDEETLAKALDKIGRVVERGTDKKLKPEYDTLQKVKHVLMEEKNHIRFSDWDVKDIEILNKYLFLTSKPAMYLINLSEKDFIKKKNKWLIKIKEWVDKHDPGALIIPFSGAFEHKLVEEYEDPVLRKKFLEDNSVTSALDKIVVNGYKALQLEYFFTAGPDEVKAWTIQKGTKAPQAAGRIHTDFEKGFIMAEVMKFNDFKEEGSEAACKGAGKYRQQGRNYVVEDGDIIFFKFNAGAGLKDAKKK